MRNDMGFLSISAIGRDYGAKALNAVSSLSIAFVSLRITKGIDLDQSPPASRVRRNLTRHHRQRVLLAAGEPGRTR
jgi:hypothetical protein